MKPKLFAFFALCAMMLAAGCSGEPAGLVDPENAEQIFVGNDEQDRAPISCVQSSLRATITP